MTKNKKSREQRLQMAPEFSSGGLAAALGNKDNAAPASPTPSDAGAPDQEWAVFGVDIVAQMAAENAAQTANQPLGAWLSDLIAEMVTGKK